MYERLERDGRIRREDVEPVEIAAALDHAASDLAAAQHNLGTSDDWALTAAHNAALQAARAYMYATGYRPAAAEGHKTAFAFLRLSLTAHRDLIDFLDRVRVKRHVAVYDETGTVTRTEAEQAIRRATEFVGIVRDAIGTA
jgi:uncharacterized protein (UPF0332 family)